MKVLMVSRHVQPNIRHSNANVYRQALSLKVNHGIDVEILTWPLNDQWEGPVPDKAAGCTVPPCCLDVGGLRYHIIAPPRGWNERPIRSDEWEAATELGMRMLEWLKPDIVHLQHWFGLWWILESAQRLGIPTVYSNHDWGMACLRTVLVMGDDTLCDGDVSIEKCARCIWQGRGLVGKANEIVADTFIGRTLIEAIYRSPFGHVFERREAVRLPVRARVSLNLSRAKRVLGRLGAMFTPSKFGCDFFSRLGVPTDRIQVKPWYHDPSATRVTVDSTRPFTITYIGRVSPEKGVHLVFEALARAKLKEPIQLRIAGADASTYCMRLKAKYTARVGIHEVQWLGWSEIETLFLSTDVSVVPSTWIDNTPLSLVEALSYRVPVIATKVPAIEELIVDGRNGYLADYMSIGSLATAIEHAVRDKPRIRSGSMPFPAIDTCCEYTLAVKNVYLSICRIPGCRSSSVS